MIRTFTCLNPTHLPFSMPPSAPHKTTSREKQICPCCGCKLHPDTVTRHLRGDVPALYQASQQVEQERDDGWSILADARPVKRSRRTRDQAGIVSQQVEGHGGSSLSGARQQPEGVILLFGIGMPLLTSQTWKANCQILCPCP